MRNRIASAYKNPAVRFIVIALLAGTAAGCSSDATRFDSFYNSADNLSTGSIRGSGVNGQVPTPSANVASAGNLPPRSDLSDPMSQPMPPVQANAQYGSPLPVSSNARVVSSSPVQSAALGAPLPPAAPTQTAPVHQAQAETAPAKGHTNIRMVKGADPISTGTVAASQPAQGKQVASVEPKAGEQVKTAQAPGKVPVPTKGPKQEAVLPSTPQAEKKKVATAEAKDGAKGNTHKVASGESLIAIAKKNGVSVEALRAANGLTSNAVRAGQELKIPATSATKVAEKPATEKVTADDMTTASVSGKPEAPLKPKATQPAAAAAAPAASADSKESVSAAAGTQVASTAPAETGIGKYRWPATGAVIAAYGANVDGQRNDGIDISVPEGTPVKAAENGVVIYAGNGLEKLGNTVLIRHADGKVTVYAHLKSIEVNRGDKVNRGQVVADSGMSGSASRPKLHFEVRKNSAPINPMSFLE